MKQAKARAYYEQTESDWAADQGAPRHGRGCRPHPVPRRDHRHHGPGHRRLRRGRHPDPRQADRGDRRRPVGGGAGWRRHRGRGWRHDHRARPHRWPPALLAEPVPPRHSRRGPRRIREDAAWRLRGRVPAARHVCRQFPHHADAARRGRHLHHRLLAQHAHAGARRRRVPLLRRFRHPRRPCRRAVQHRRMGRAPPAGPDPAPRDILQRRRLRSPPCA